MTIENCAPIVIEVSGHAIDSCDKKHGYPPGYRFYSNGQNNQANNVIASSDNFFEHWSKEQENKDNHFTTQQYQILYEMLKKK